MIDPERAIEILSATVRSVVEGWEIHDSEAVRTGASLLTATSDELSGSDSIPRPAESALWLISRSAESLHEAITQEPPDWDRVGAASAFAESGVDQLSGALGLN